MDVGEVIVDTYPGGELEPLYPGGIVGTYLGGRHPIFHVIICNTIAVHLHVVLGGWHSRQDTAYGK